MRNYGVRFQSVTVSTVAMKQWHIRRVRKTKKSDSWIKIFDSHYSHLWNCQTRVYLCSDWLVTALSGLCQADRAVQHTSATPPQPSISLRLSPASAHFTLTNVREQAALAGPWEAGRGAMDLIDKCLRVAFTARSHFVCVHTDCTYWMSVRFILSFCEATTWTAHLNSTLMFDWD